MLKCRPTTAFVLGAGLGTRLRPLTNRRPKPLIPLCEQPLIVYAFDHLIDFGIERFVVNTHWCAHRYKEFFPEECWKGRPIHFSHESPEILETAGGIWNAKDLLQDGSFVVYNGDILCDLPIGEAWERHLENSSEVTLVLREQADNRNVAFDPVTAQVIDLRRVMRPEIPPGHLFTGIYFVEPDFINRIPRNRKLSVVPIFHEMIRDGSGVGGVVINAGNWRDLGTRDEYLAASASLGYPQWISPAAKIGEGSRLEDCIVWEGAEVLPGSHLTRCVVTDGAVVGGVHVNEDF